MAMFSSYVSYQRVNIDTPWLQLSYRGGDAGALRPGTKLLLYSSNKEPLRAADSDDLAWGKSDGKIWGKIGENSLSLSIFFRFFDVWFVTGFGLSLSGELVAGLSRRNIHSESWVILGVTLTFLLIINGLNYWRAWNMVLSKIGLSKNSVITMIRYASFNFP